MDEATKILAAIEAGEPQAAERLLPLVYDELRHLAAARLAGEAPGQTLQATALVHEAWLKLAGEDRRQWQGRTISSLSRPRPCAISSLTTLDARKPCVTGLDWSGSASTTPPCRSQRPAV